MSGNDQARAGALFERGKLLLSHNRPAEAESFFRQGLAQEPNDVQALYLLACCVHEAGGREAQALEIIERAIGLDPQWAPLHARRAIFLSGLKRLKEAHSSADRAIALDPESEIGHGAKGYVFMRESRWAEAEEHARRALTMDADDILAQNVLSQSLLWQGKAAESQADIAVRLARNPEDEMTHYNAGYAALRAGQYQKAETHFLEALRLDPTFDGARQGLLECFRARSLFYRSYLKYAFAMARLSEKNRTFVVIGIYIVYRVMRGVLGAVSPLLSTLLVLLYFLWVTWSYVARGVANLMVLFDGHARHALKTREKWEGLTVGGGVAAGLLLVIAGAALRDMSFVICGACLAGPAIPLSLTFSNDNRTGVKLYGALAGITILCAAALLLGTIAPAWVPREVTSRALGIGSLCVAVATLLGAFRVKYD